MSAVHPTVNEARSSPDVEVVRRLFRAYAEALPFSLDFQGFEAELGGLPAPYTPPGGCLLLAWRDGDQGEITLNYVSPDARFSGVSRALIAALEARAVERGNRRCTLVSTETALRFYRSAGYVQDGPAQGKFDASGSYPMAKRLSGE